MTRVKNIETYEDYVSRLSTSSQFEFILKSDLYHTHVSDLLFW